MVLHYRETDPVSGRWTANTSGVPLSSFQGDENIYTLNQAIAAVAATVTPSRTVSSITQSGNDLTFHMSDSTMEGPFTIEPATFLDRGTWAPSTAYSVNDTFSINGTLYRVIFAHTSALTFSAGANDGLGHNYYSAMLSAPGSGLPTGGATAQVLQKSSGTDFATTWGYKLPTGGATYQVLLKQSSTNQDANWTTLNALHVSFLPSTASGLTSTNVADALEEIEGNITGAGIALSSLSDVNVTEGAGIDGYTLTWNNATSKWVAGATPNNLAGMTDVNVTEGAGIDGFFLQWNNSTGKWIAAASSTSLAGLADVNVTEGSGIHGYFLKWNNGTSKWIASTVPLSGLSDVNVTEGSGIHGYCLKWNNSTSKWIAGALGSIATFPETTTAQYLANTSGKALSTDKVWAAADLVSLTDASTVALDMSTFINGTVTLGGNRTLGNPSNTKNGQTGVIEIKQDGTGSRTLAYSSNWKFAGGTAPTLTTAASARDLLFYQVISSTVIYGTLVKDVK